MAGFVCPARPSSDRAALGGISIDPVVPAVRIVLCTEDGGAMLSSGLNNLKKVIGLLQRQRLHQPFVQDKKIRFGIGLCDLPELVLRPGNCQLIQKGVAFETAIIERYRHRESSVEEALIEMYLAGVSVRRVEDITEALWGSKVSPSTISELNKKAYVHIEDWCNRPLQGGRYPYVYVDGIYLRRNWGGEYENVAILVAIAVNEDGYRVVLGAAEGMKEDKASWISFFQWHKGRGLSGVKLIVGDKCVGMLEAVGKVFPDAKYKRCIVHFYRNVFSVVPKSKVKQVAKMLKAIHAQESK